MQQGDFREFAEMMVGAWAMYERELRPQSQALMFRALEHLTLERVKDGLNRHMRDAKAGQYPPKPADVIRQLEGTSEDAKLDDESQARAAWEQVLREVRRTGQYEDCPITDPRALAAIEDAGGWPVLCQIKTEDIPHVRREFVKAYQLLDAPGTPRAALGIHSRNNERLNGAGGEARQIGASLPKVGRG